MLLWVTCAGAGMAQSLETTRAHRESLQRGVGALLSRGDAAGAETFADAETRKAETFPRNDGRRANAQEVWLQARLAHLDDKAAATPLIQPASELVAARRAARPADPELLAAALLLQGTVLFAADDSAGADRAFEQRLALLRSAYAANPAQLARQLSMTARNIEEGYGRFERAASLYKEAIALRRARGADAARDQAADLQSLGMLKMGRFNETQEGEDSLGAATDILETVLAREPQASDVWQGLIQIFVLRAGIAQQRGAPDEAALLLDNADKIAAGTKAGALANANTVALGRARIAELERDWDGAMAAYSGIVTRIRQQPAAARTDDDKGLLLDVLTGLAKLYVAKGDMVAARTRVEEALAGYPADDPARADAYFALAEVERSEGHAQRQIDAYREALKITRQSASEQPIHFATNREIAADRSGTHFLDRPAASPKLGKATVIVPGGQYSTEANRKRSGTEAETFGASTDPLQLSIQSGPEVLEPAAAAARINAELRRAARFPGSALVFVHGFNVAFDEALKRMGQLKRDLAFDGPVVAFAWPTAGHWWRYGTDRAAAAAATEGLGKFLEWLAANTDARQIHVMAHSMGNRILLPALGQLAAPARGRIGEIIFAAPAVGIAEFSTQLDALKASGYSRLTLYASRNDLALRAGFVREFATTLAGFIPGSGPFLKPGLDTVDVSEGGSETFEFNHDVFAANPAIIDDIRQLLQSGLRPPGKRLTQLVQRAGKEGAPYWYYEARARN